MLSYCLTKATRIIFKKFRPLCRDWKTTAYKWVTESRNLIQDDWTWNLLVLHKISRLFHWHSNGTWRNSWHYCAEMLSPCRVCDQRTSWKSGLHVHHEVLPTRVDRFVRFLSAWSSLTRFLLSLDNKRRQIIPIIMEEVRLPLPLKNIVAYKFYLQNPFVDFYEMLKKSLKNVVPRERNFSSPGRTWNVQVVLDGSLDQIYVDFK